MSKHRRSSGYTLIEVLVVIFIISIATSVTLLTIGKNENREIETFAKELTQMVSLAEEQAMLQPRVLGIALNSNTIQFASFDKDKETQKSTWLPLSDHVLHHYAVPDNIQISLHISGSQIALNGEPSTTPQIIFSTNGDVTPFVMYVGKKGKKPAYAISADADGNVDYTAIS